MRIDRYLWCVRLFKTRSQAGKACDANKVMIEGEFVKTSKEIKVGDAFAIKAAPIWRTYEVLDIPKNRVGAKLVPNLIKETTIKEDMDLYETVQKENRDNRSVGIKGRPTKKDRRDMDQYRD